MQNLDDIVKKNLCLGCGLCEAIGKQCGYKMELRSNGFYIPTIPSVRNFELEKKMLSICPAIHLVGDDGLNIWGNFEQVAYAYSTDSEIRFRASSGGVISGICVYLIENKIVDAILHVGNDKNSFLFNSLSESISRNEILKKSSSRYAPAQIFNNLLTLLQASNKVYCFVGKPCDIQGIKNLLTLYPQYESRFKFFISMFCAGMPSYNASRKLLNTFRENENPLSLRYRGDGWPGYFKATYQDGLEQKISYSDSWGKFLGRQSHFRCKICPDGIGLRADIVVGDAWETKDGYPDFTERNGRSFILIRSLRMKELIVDMKKQMLLAIEMLDCNQIQNMQPYQYDRRLSVGYKIVVVSILSRLKFDFKGVLSVNFLKKISILRAIKIVLGTIKRSFNRNNY